MAELSNVRVMHDQAAHRFEAEVNGGTAFVSYELRGGDVVFTHTEVPVQSRGEGIADDLARTALGWAHERGLNVIPECPFIAAYVRRHSGSGNAS